MRPRPPWGLRARRFTPQISLSASASFQSNVIEKLFNAGGIGTSLGGSLTAPLFNHGRLRARQRAALDELQASMADYQQTLLSGFSQVADALQSLDHDQELLASEQAAVQVAAQNLDLTRESYSAGNSGVLQVLDAQRADQQARLGWVRGAIAAFRGCRAAAAGTRWRDSAAGAVHRGSLTAARPLSVNRHRFSLL